MHPSRKHMVYSMSMTKKDEVRIRALAAALVAQSGGVHVGPAAAVRWALAQAERVLGLEGVGPGSASPVGGPKAGPSHAHTEGVTGRGEALSG